MYTSETVARQTINQTRSFLWRINWYLDPRMALFSCHFDYERKGRLRCDVEAVRSVR